MNEAKLRSGIIEAGRDAIEELIIVAEESISIGDDILLAADKLKNVAASKKLTISDALSILDKIEDEERKVLQINGIDDDDLSSIQEKNMKTRKRIIEAAKSTVSDLNKIAKRKIIIPTTRDEDGKIIDKSIAADKWKNAASAKKLAIFDALEILDIVQVEESKISEFNVKDGRKLNNFAENRAK